MRDLEAPGCGAQRVLARRPRPGLGCRLNETDHADEVGVGPHPQPWPDDPRLDPELLRDGDRRNVVDRYRYWRVEAIVADLDTRRHPFAVAIENWRHDLNIGTVVRTANAFLAREVVIVGNRRWNRRGAMVTDRYQHIRHVPDGARRWPSTPTGAGYTMVGDRQPARRRCRWRRADLPRRTRCCCSARRGPGSARRRARSAATVCSIAQFGSTRSINAGVAAGHRDARLDPPARPDRMLRDVRGSRTVHERPRWSEPAMATVDGPGRRAPRVSTWSMAMSGGNQPFAG